MEKNLNKNTDLHYIQQHEQNIGISYYISFAILLFTVWFLNRFLLIDLNWLFITIGIMGLIVKTATHFSLFQFEKWKNKISKISFDFIYLLYSLSYLALTVGLIKMFLFEHNIIPSESMKPNLLVNDIVYINKLNTQYQRHDVIVFKYPLDTRINYIKRIVGMPNETIEVINNQIVINNEPIKQELIGKNQHIDHVSQVNTIVHEYQITEYRIWENENKKLNYPSADNNMNNKFQEHCQIINKNHIKCTIPQDHYFVMGDNRDNSIDSRFWGLVHKKHILGKTKQKNIFTNINQN